MDFARGRVFAACMSTPSNRPLSNLSFLSGAVFLISGLSAVIFGSEVFAGISLWSVPVLLIALVTDVARKRYWALVPLVLVGAALGWFVWFTLALRSFDIPVGG